jgi:hypothetical protein
MNLDGTSFSVSATAGEGVVSAETHLQLIQRGSRVLGRYAGGSIVRGCLVGTVDGTELRFRYVQRERAGGIHAGRSICRLERLDDGRLRLREYFKWTTRSGSGTNVFEQVDAQPSNAS